MAIRPSTHLEEWRSKQAIITLLFALSWLPSTASAHGGHDHGDEKAPLSANEDRPQRLPDGTLFLPKPSQRTLGIRTARVSTQSLPKVIELAGKVVLDPHLGGQVHSLIAGRIESHGGHGLPIPGTQVKKGEILAWVVPSAGRIERFGQAALLGELKASRELASKRLTRQQTLTDIIPRKDIETTESELQSLDKRIAAISAGLSGREALISPVSGVIASSNAVIGAVVEPKELVFEVLDPDSLHIEATAYDPIQANDIATAHIAPGDISVPLKFVGAAGRLREQSQILLFERHAPKSGLTLGLPLKVQIHTRTKIQGIPLLAKALSRNSANEIIVWIKQSPEHFVSRVVQTLPFDGIQVMVTQGLEDGERVVIQGAGLISQIR